MFVCTFFLSSLHTYSKAQLSTPSVCTPVQAETLPVILSGLDVLAKAKTGTGKTLAFLLPSLEILIRSKPPPRIDQISILIISPTRELATQISIAAEELLRYTPYKVAHVVGGNKKKLGGERCDILVGTPGRMVDLLENAALGNRLKNVKAFVMDEADRLLDGGFRKDLTKIIGHLPDRKLVPRQSLLFSATIPPTVHQVRSFMSYSSYAVPTSLF